jgi:hypothetical protein
MQELDPEIWGLIFGQDLFGQDRAQTENLTRDK